MSVHNGVSRQFAARQLTEATSRLRQHRPNLSGQCQCGRLHPCDEYRHWQWVKAYYEARLSGAASAPEECVVEIWTGREERILRRAKRMTLRQFAAYLGISERSISKWEAGDRRTVPRPDAQILLDGALAQLSPGERARFILMDGLRRRRSRGRLAFYGGGMARSA